MNKEMWQESINEGKQWSKKIKQKKRMSVLALREKAFRMFWVLSVISQKKSCKGEAI